MKKKILFSVLSYLAVALMGVILALDYRIFVVSNDFAPSGVNGIAVLIQYKFGFSIGYMSLLINVPLCIAAFFLVDWEFALKSFLFSLCYSFAYLGFQNLSALDDFVYSAGGIDTIYPVLIAGTIMGGINGLLFRLGGSSAGTDVIGKYIAKKKPELNFFWVTFVLNIVVAIISCFVYKENNTPINYKPACLCIVYSLMSATIGNFIIKGTKTAAKFVIITSHPEEIEQVIVHELRHSATILQGKGAYSGQDKTVLICLVNKNQLHDLETELKRFPDTFSFVETANETIGNFKFIHHVTHADRTKKN